MRVIYIVHSCEPYGSNVALINLLDRLIYKGVKPLVIYAIDGEFRKWLDERGIQSVKIAHNFHAYPYVSSFKSKIAFFPRILKMLFINEIAKNKLLNIVNHFKPEIIHTNIGPVSVGFKVAKRKDIPHVWHLREYQKLDFDINFFPSFDSFKKQTKLSNLICITQNIYNFYEIENNGRVIYDGVMDESEIQFLKNKEKYFLFVGRLEDAKGTFLLVKAFCSFAIVNNEYSLYLAGTGSDNYITEIKNYLEERKLTDRVFFLGFRTDRYDLMANATALVVPSRHEGFGFITAEAMFNGCLVIGNNIAGTKEIIENSNNNAITFNNSAELTKSLLEVATNGIEKYYSKIIIAQEIAKEIYTKEQHATNVLEYYNSILIKKK
jgi:glycosyltransferase involved in cell wall biosynthesis